MIKPLAYAVFLPGHRAYRIKNHIIPLVKFTITTIIYPYRIFRKVIVLGSALFSDSMLPAITIYSHVIGS